MAWVVVVCSTERLPYLTQFAHLLRCGCSYFFSLLSRWPSSFVPILTWHELIFAPVQRNEGLITVTCSCRAELSILKDIYQKWRIGIPKETNIPFQRWGLWPAYIFTNQGEIFDLGQIAEWTVSSSRANISVPATVPGGIYSDLRQVDSEIHSMLESWLVNAY